MVKDYMEPLIFFLDKLADNLDEAPRQGAENDTPEGLKYILISDTLAKELSYRLREFASVLKDDGK